MRRGAVIRNEGEEVSFCVVFGGGVVKAGVFISRVPYDVPPPPPVSFGVDRAVDPFPRRRLIRAGSGEILLRTEGIH